MPPPCGHFKCLVLYTRSSDVAESLSAVQRAAAGQVVMSQSWRALECLDTSSCTQDGQRRPSPPHHSRSASESTQVTYSGTRHSRASAPSGQIVCGLGQFECLILHTRSSDVAENLSGVQRAAAGQVVMSQSWRALECLDTSSCTQDGQRRPSPPHHSRSASENT